MDNKNVFIAIALSMSVLLFWAAFFESPRPVNENNIQQKKSQKSENIITPNINETLRVIKITRKDAIKSSERIKVENDNIKGSINLEGGVIDDISFKKHKKNLENNLNVEFLNPEETENGFYIETGWTSVGNKIKVPSRKSKWKISGNKFLKENSPILLEWSNGENIVFKKKIEIDNKYLFKITQQVYNNSNKTIELYPYAQITRNKVPEDIQDFYISHEGFIGVFNEELKEDDYDDIKEKK